MSKEVIYDQQPVVYDVQGHGRTVVLIHGFGETRSVWSNQVKALQQKFRVITPDLPGSGDSPLVDDMSMEGLAEAVKAVIDGEVKPGDPRPVIIGHSMGGYVLLALLEKYPGYTSAFGLFHSSAFPDSEEKKETRRRGIAFVRQHGAFEFLKTTAPNLFSPGSRQRMPAVVDQFIRSLNNFSPESLVKYYEAMIHRPDRQQVLKATAVPVLFVLGKYDMAVPFNDGLKLCHLPGKAYIEVLHQSAHMGMMEEHEKSNQLLERFLTET